MKGLVVRYVPAGSSERRSAPAVVLEDQPWGWGDMACSEDLRHRYTLALHFDHGSILGERRRVVFVMLNPSTAWGNELDPTLERWRP